MTEKQLTIAVIVGSLRKDSINKRMASALEKLGGTHVTFERIEIGDLPLYNQDDDANQAAPVLRMKQAIEAADGVLFVTPEYNRSIPGVLKNAIDHGSRPSGKSSWNGKPAGIIGVSPSAAGTSMAQQHLRNVLANQDMPTLAQPEGFIQMKDGLFTDKGEIGDASRKYLQGWMDKFIGWAEAHRK